MINHLGARLLYHSLVINQVFSHQKCKLKPTFYYSLWNKTSNNITTKPGSVLNAALRSIQEKKINLETAWHVAKVAFSNF